MISPITEATSRLLEISGLPGMGTASLRKVVLHVLRRGTESLGSNEEVWETFAHKSVRTAKVVDNQKDKILDQCVKHEIGILSPVDQQYPKALLHVEDFPPILYFKGRSELLGKLSIAVVGTREPSPLGASWARQIAEIFARNGFSIVSGLALGIDMAAHEGALKASGRTVAVLAHGLDSVTPASNRDLAGRILDSGGALIAEHPPGFPPRRQEYVRRNRIQSGMSVGSVVVESGEEGGAIYQGKFTTAQGRKLFCIVPDQSVAGREHFRDGGARVLIRDALAEPIKSSVELLKVIQSGELQALFTKLGSTSPLSGELF